MRRFFFLKQNGKFVCITLILMFSKMIFNLLIFLKNIRSNLGNNNIHVCKYFAYSNWEAHFSALQFTFSQVIKIILHWILSFKLMQYIVL